MNDTRQRAWFALPFAAAMLLTTLFPTGAVALFGGKRAAETAPAQGAPIAQNLELKAYRGVACTGTLKAVDNEGEAVIYQIATLPAKGTLECGDGGVFVYTPAAAIAMATNSPRVTVRSGSKNHSSPSRAPTKMPCSARSTAAVAQSAPSVSA